MSLISFVIVICNCRLYIGHVCFIHVCCVILVKYDDDDDDDSDSFQCIISFVVMLAVQKSCQVT